MKKIDNKRVKITTITKKDIVNLSNTDYIESDSVQFLKIDNGIKTFKWEQIKIDGESDVNKLKNSDIIFVNDAKNKVFSPYVTTDIINIRVKAHKNTVNTGPS